MVCDRRLEILVTIHLRFDTKEARELEEIELGTS